MQCCYYCYNNNKEEKSTEKIRTITPEELGQILEGEEKMAKEMHGRRKNLFFRKGKKWSGSIKLEDWIRESAKEWNIDQGIVIKAAGMAKIVTFRKKGARNEFWRRREEILNQGQYEVDEDLTFEERVRRHNMVERGKILRNEGFYCRVENRYLVAEKEGTREYCRWHPDAGFNLVSEPVEEAERKEKEKQMRKAKEEEERRKREDW